METAPTQNDRLTLTEEEAAQALGLRRTLADEAVRTDDLPSLRIGRAANEGDGMSTLSTAPLTLTVEEAARALGISRTLAYEAARTGDLPSVRIGRRLLVPREALERRLGRSDTRSPRSREAQSDQHLLNDVPSPALAPATDANAHEHL